MNFERIFAPVSKEEVDLKKKQTNKQIKETNKQKQK